MTVRMLSSLLFVAQSVAACSSYGPSDMSFSYRVQNDGDYPVEVEAQRAACDGEDRHTVEPHTAYEGTAKQRCDDYDDTTVTLRLTIIGKVTKSRFLLDWRVYVPTVPEGAVFKLARAPGAAVDATTKIAAPEAAFEVEPTTDVFYLGVSEDLLAPGLSPPPGSYADEGFIFLPYQRQDQHDTQTFNITNAKAAVCTSTSCVEQKEQP